MGTYSMIQNPDHLRIGSTRIHGHWKGNSTGSICGNRDR